MKAFYSFFFFFAFFTQPQAAPFSDLQTKIDSFESPNQRLSYLQSIKDNYINQDVSAKANYWLLLGLALEENNQLEKAFEVFNQSIHLLSSTIEDNREVYIKTLIQRSYVVYLQTNDTEQYCPDRALAYNALKETTSVDLQIRTYVHYAICFQQKKTKFATGLEILDKALALAKKNNLSPNTHAMIYNASGLIYGKNQMYTQAYNFLFNAYQQWQSVNDYQDMFNMLHSLSNVSVNMGEFDQAQIHVEAMFDLAKEQTSFKDFLFFAQYNAAFVALAKGQIEQSTQYLSLALEEQNNTHENYFIKNAYQQIIINFFRLGKNYQALRYQTLFREKYPEHQLSSNQIDAFTLFQEEEYLSAINKIFDQLDHEINERRLFIKHATQATALVNSQSIFELDKQILEKTVEIQNLTLKQEQNEKRIVYLILFLVLILSIGLAVFCYYLYKTRKYFQYHARTDYLTGVFNRRFLFETGTKLINQANSLASPLSTLLFDIDNFKTINDTKGHLVGDLAIKLVVKQCRKYLPNSAIIGRLGGDEFLVILPKTNLVDAQEIAENIRHSINTYSLPEIESLPLSVSIGVVDNSKPNDLDAMIADADQLLYAAKTQGRNIVITSS